jgi:restriction system protein
MTIWAHLENGDVPLIEEVNRSECRFCGSELKWKDVNDVWPGTSNGIEIFHKETIIDMAEAHGDFILEELELTESPYQGEVQRGCCPMCGWWLISKEVFLSTRNRYWLAEYGTTGALKNFDMTDINLPISEIRNYLVAKYESRFSVNPKTFEETVASVFRSLGYRSHVTGFTADGGIDVVLHGCSGDTVGVQVKRYKNSIKAEQIRAFLGAVILGKHTKGIFVTTSEYQGGARKTAKSAGEKGVPIELINASDFLSMLQIAQMNDYRHSPDFFRPYSEAQPLELYFAFEYHLNSL